MFLKESLNPSVISMLQLPSLLVQPPMSANPNNTPHMLFKTDVIETPVLLVPHKNCLS